MDDQDNSEHTCDQCKWLVVLEPNERALCIHGVPIWIWQWASQFTYLETSSLPVSVYTFYTNRLGASAEDCECFCPIQTREEK